METNYQVMSSPVGNIYIVSQNESIIGILFDSNWPRFKKKFTLMTGRATPVINEAQKQMREYFAGHRREFELPLQPYGTDFQSQTWDSLKKIPYGKTWSYQELAHAVKKPKAVRAVGSANARNPISIVVPCHRVIRSDGAISGYAGTPASKRLLLDLERENALK